MTWLTREIQMHIADSDTVLDLGCGLMHATKELHCRSILGCDGWQPYLDMVKQEHPTAFVRMHELDRFMDQSFDIVLALDVIEHLDKSDALVAIWQMKRICRKKAIIFTPREFTENHENVENAWDMGTNQLQKHRCLITTEKLAELGFAVGVPYQQDSTFAVYSK